jgi:hypothetical protein
MIVAAFLVTALAGMVVGIWLSARAAKGQMLANPVRVWAFVDTLKQKTIEAYADELVHALSLKSPPEQDLTAEEVATFIKTYTEEVLKHKTTRR